MTDAWGEPRSRTTTWYDPAPAVEASRTRSGLEHLRAVAAGELPPPPIAALFGMEMRELDDGLAVFTCEPGEWAYNPIGVVHGGLVCTLLDSVVGCALHTTLPAGTAYTSLELKVSYLRPVTRDSGVLVATGRVVRRGRRAGFADGEVVDASGKAVATASSTLLVMS